MEKNMTMAFISAVHATELLPNVVRGAKVTTRREEKTREEDKLCGV